MLVLDYGKVIRFHSLISPHPDPLSFQCWLVNETTYANFPAITQLGEGLIKVFRLLFGNGWIFKLNVLKLKRKRIRQNYSTAFRVKISEVKAQESFFVQHGEQLRAHQFPLF